MTSVAVALSGGVDSAMAAVLLKESGFQVCGLHLVLSDATASRQGRARGVAERLGIPLDILDLRERFETRVIGPFCDAYLGGVTPNPCVGCNAEIKFDALYRYCIGNGIDVLATGHYAHVIAGPCGTGLFRGMDAQKDQSYFLQRVSRECLSRASFPLGRVTKDEVRVRARDMGLPCHDRPESQEICFITGMDYREFVALRRGPGIRKKGFIVSDEGQVLGEHEGVYRYTIGQRHGLGIASSSPYYVKEIRPDLNHVVVARREALFSRVVEACDMHWIAEPSPADGARMLGQVRYRHRAAPGRLEIPAHDRVRFRFEAPQWAITPGQALALYDGERLLGGGWITRAGG